MTRQTAAYRPSQNILRIGTVMGVPQALRDLGLDPAEVLNKGGFDPDIFDDPENLIPFAARGRLIAHCAASAKCEHFGLLVGKQAGLDSLGLVGLLVKYSPDVLAALNNLTRYFHLHGHGSTISLQVQGATAILGYQIQQSEAKGNHQIGAGAVAILHNIVRELCGRRWKSKEAWFMQCDPDDAEPFRRFFKTNLRFNADQNALVFRSRWLANVLPDVHPDMRKLLQEQIDALAARHEHNFPAQVRTVLRAALVNGDVKADRIAALFSIHPRTLNRRLHDYGIGYRELVDETLFEIAQQLLKNSDLGVSEIALMLHYADARSFIRAFRRWSGKTPAHWRATGNI